MRYQPLASTLLTVLVPFALVACGAGGGESDTTTAASAPTQVPTIETQPSPATVDAGEVARFSVAAKGKDPLTYQWQRDGVDIVGATSSHFVTGITSISDGGVRYAVKVSNAQGSVISTAAMLSVKVTAHVHAVPGYLAIGHVPLAELNSSLGVVTDWAPTQISGPAMQFAIDPAHVLHYLSPTEQFGSTTSMIALTDASGGKIWMLGFDWSSRTGPSLTRISEADENGAVDGDDEVTLTATGLGDDGHVGPNTTALGFVLANAPAIDPTRIEVGLDTAVASHDITGYFEFNAATGALTLAADKVATLLALVKAANVVTLSLSLSTARYAETFGFEQALTYAGGTIDVSVLDAEEMPAVDLAGATFVARGFNTGATASAQLDANGNLSLTGLPADSYQVSQVLLSSGIPLTGFATLERSTSALKLTLRRGSDPPAAPARSVTAAQVQKPAACPSRRESLAATYPSSRSSDSFQMNCPLP